MSRMICTAACHIPGDCSCTMFRPATTSTTTAAALLLGLAVHLLARTTCCDAANILAVQTVPGTSHWNVMKAVLRALTDRGHNVTVFVPFAVDRGGDYAELVDVYDGAVRVRVGLDAAFLIENYGTTRAVMRNMVDVTRSVCDAIHGHRRMREILGPRPAASPPPFDAVVTEPFASECVAYPATVLRVPMVYVMPPPVVTYLERSLSGHHPNPAAVAHVLSAHGRPRTFADRLSNALVTVHCAAVAWTAERLHALSDPRPYDRVALARPAVTFANTHFVTEPARPLTPDVVQIGGIHLGPVAAVPADILEFIDDSPHGVIYFTFGSTVSMSSLPESVHRAFVEALGQVPQRVLWKYEGEMKDKPKNVMTKKWFPQRDILLHPNVKLFISHGGISGVYEAVDAGVPVLGFPFYYDQPRNIANLVEAGMAISMDLLSVSTDTLLRAVLELVTDDSYRKNAKIASEQFKDRPMSPTESVVYWTEYVLRHKGAPHLKSHALNLTWYQYFLVDVILAFLMVAFVVSFLIFYSLKPIYKYTFKRFSNAKAKHE